MIIVEHEEDRSSLVAAQASQELVAAQADVPVADARMVESFVAEWSSPAATFA